MIERVFCTKNFEIIVQNVWRYKPKFPNYSSNLDHSIIDGNVQENIYVYKPN